MRLGLIGLACFLAATASAASAPIGQVAPVDGVAPDEGETLDSAEIGDRRLTLPVNVDGRGPFHFIVDTGSERTVIARELAETLGLDPSEDIWLASVIDVQQVPTVIIPRLDIGRLSIDDLQAPALERRHLGAEGVIGIDALEDRRVLLDFARGQMTLTRSQVDEPDWPRDATIIVRARSRFGRLVLADAELEGTRVYAIVDTGTSISIGNMALRDRLVRRGRMDPSQVFTLTAVTGATRTINYTIAEELEIGGVAFNELPVAFLDTELFRRLDLEDRPAMLLGMNALRAFERVSIDFANRRIRMQLPDAGVAPQRYRQMRADLP